MPHIEVELRYDLDTIKISVDNYEDLTEQLKVFLINYFEIKKITLL